MMHKMRRAFYLGLGGLSFTREKAEQLVDELVKKKDLEASEAQGLVNDLVTRGEKEKEAINSHIQKEITTIRSELGMVTQAEISELEKRLQAIEERLTKLEELNNPASTD